MILSLITSGLSISEILISVVAVAVSATLAIVGHEVSHGYVALWCGDDTAKQAGRLSFNPLVHFDWIGLILLAFVGFGWAKPVPINPANFKNKKAGIILVSLAGITANLIMAGIGLLLIFLLFCFYIAKICTIRILAKLLRA